MIKITAAAIRDFQICALLYNYRHGLDPKERPFEYIDNRHKKMNRYDETINRIAAFFFYKKQALTEPSYQALQNRWSKLWYAEGTNAVDIATLRNESVWGNDTSYTTEAALGLMDLHQRFGNKPELQVVLVDEKFTVPWNKDVALEGVFDVVLREKLPNDTWQYHIYKWVHGPLKKASKASLFDIAVLDYAFKYRNDNRPLNIKYHLWTFLDSTKREVEIELEKDDLNLLSYWIDSIMDTDIFAPRRGLTFYCKSCPFDKPCSRWRPPEKAK